MQETRHVFFYTLLSYGLLASLIQALEGKPSWRKETQLPTGTDAWFDALIFILFVVVFFVSYYFRPRASEKRWLTTHGKRVSATVAKIDMHPQGTRAGMIYEYSVQARWQDRETGQVHLVRSGWVPHSYLKPYGNPSLSRTIAPGEPIEVLVDPKDADHALIAALPPLIYRKYGRYGES
jgi:hypothetical protein